MSPSTLRSSRSSPPSSGRVARTASQVITIPTIYSRNVPRPAEAERRRRLPIGLLNHNLLSSFEPPGAHGVLVDCADRSLGKHAKKIDLSNCSHDLCDLSNCERRGDDEGIYSRAPNEPENNVAALGGRATERTASERAAGGEVLAGGGTRSTRYTHCGSTRH